MLYHISLCFVMEQQRSKARMPLEHLKLSGWSATGSYCHSMGLDKTTRTSSVRTIHQHKDTGYIQEHKYCASTSDVHILRLSVTLRVEK